MARILLIEPDQVLAEVYRQALQAEGHSVVLSTSAQAAVMVADDHQPDLVIIELQLVEHSGIEFLYEFRSYPDWQNIAVIIHSQVPPGEFAANWPLIKAEFNIATYLYKPLTSLRELSEAVDAEVALAGK
jgi:DNA-binding response OmpR family regulator